MDIQGKHALLLAPWKEIVSTLEKKLLTFLKDNQVFKDRICVIREFEGLRSLYACWFHVVVTKFDLQVSYFERALNSIKHNCAWVKH